MSQLWFPTWNNLKILLDLMITVISLNNGGLSRGRGKCFQIVVYTSPWLVRKCVLGMNTLILHSF